MRAGAKHEWLAFSDTPGTHLSRRRVKWRVWDLASHRGSVRATLRSMKDRGTMGLPDRHAVTFAALVFFLAQMAVVIAPTPAAATSRAPWAIAAGSKSTVGGYDFLTDVACSSVRDCTAVGYYYRASNVQTLIERWNGSKWLVTPSPNTNERLDNDLSGIACVSPRSCTAVGYHDDGHAARAAGRAMERRHLVDRAERRRSGRVQRLPQCRLVPLPGRLHRGGSSARHNGQPAVDRALERNRVVHRTRS